MRFTALDVATMMMTAQRMYGTDGQLHVDGSRERELHQHLGPVDGEERERDRHDELPGELGPLVEAEAALVADADPVVDHADDAGADDGHEHEEARRR